MKKNSKLRLFEMMSKIDPTFKPRLNESAFNSAGEPMMTHNQYRDYSEPSEPDYDDNDRQYDDLTKKEIVRQISNHFNTILNTYDGEEYYFLYRGTINNDFMLYFTKYSVSAFGPDGKEFPETNIEELNIDELINFLEPYRQYILTGRDAEKEMDRISRQNAADDHYAKQERGMMGGG
jgi:hypothetical protein